MAAAILRLPANGLPPSNRDDEVWYRRDRRLVRGYFVHSVQTLAELTDAGHLWLVKETRT